MWSLFKKKGEKENNDFSNLDKEKSNNLDIFDFSNDGEELKPICFSNGKTQADIVKEILDEIEKGAKIIFLRGVCGTGKSAIALNLARHFKKTSIVVPIKSLQEQYENDYTREKFILKQDKTKLKISVIKGRNNFQCLFSSGDMANNEELPCLIELKEKNAEKIREYLKENKAVKEEDFASIYDVKRMSIAPVCPYWSPLLPSEVNSKELEKANKRKYDSVSGKKYALFLRKTGCGYYDQYNSYIDSDVLIFNSQKYLIELAIGRKPKTDIEIIDECDEFLDSLSEEKTINLSRLLFSLSSLRPISHSDAKVIKDMIKIINEIIYSNVRHEQEAEIESLANSKYLELIESIISNPYLAENEESNYYNSVFESILDFKNFLSETYVQCFKDYKKSEKLEPNVYLSLVTINLEKRFSEILEKSQVLVLMSGTLHSPQVLKDIFGLKDFKVIDAESETPGTITKFRTGKEKNCKYENFKTKQVTRKDYLQALDLCVENAKHPILVHVNSFGDLPSGLEKAEFKIKHLPVKEELIERQNFDRNNNEIRKFKEGKIPFLFTTKCSRGIDFPGDKCNSIILTRFPYPDISSLFWKILKREKPEKFMEFYTDKAKRELLQKIYRGLRFKEDHILLLSQDSRVLDFKFEK